MAWHRFLIFFYFFWHSQVLQYNINVQEILFIQNNRKTYNPTMSYARNDLYLKYIYISDLRQNTFLDSEWRAKRIDFKMIQIIIVNIMYTSTLIKYQFFFFLMIDNMYYVDYKIIIIVFCYTHIFCILDKVRNVLILHNDVFFIFFCACFQHNLSK